MKHVNTDFFYCCFPFIDTPVEIFPQAVNEASGAGHTHTQSHLVEPFEHLGKNKLHVMPNSHFKMHGIILYYAL